MHVHVKSITCACQEENMVVTCKCRIICIFWNTKNIRTKVWRISLDILCAHIKFREKLIFFCCMCKKTKNVSWKAYFSIKFHLFYTGNKNIDFPWDDFVSYMYTRVSFCPIFLTSHGTFNMHFKNWEHMIQSVKKSPPIYTI